MKQQQDKYDILKTYYGYDTFRDGQEELIDCLLNGQDVCGIMPTGAGKPSLSGSRPAAASCYPRGLPLDFPDEGPGPCPESDGGPRSLFKQLSFLESI